MLINLTSTADANSVKKALTGLGLWLETLLDQDGTATGFIVKGHSTPVDPEKITAVDGVGHIFKTESQHPKVDLKCHKSVDVGGLQFRPAAPTLIAGPCSIDSEERIESIASQVARAGGKVLRGGAYKPRTSPYSFSGFGAPALQWMRRAADRHQLRIVTEVMSEHDVKTVADITDIVQVGSRNMQNFALLRQVGEAKKCVMLKRGRSATVSEWLMAAEYLYASGADSVLFCERGIRGFDNETRNLIDLGAVALLSHHYGLPVIVDPSHAAGRRDLVVPLSKASIAAGAVGVMVEVHPDPSTALSDGPQALSYETLRHLSKSLELECIE
ncbi:MAG: 3-deoxy-7-phosphoheptulonate synthase [Myxococcales bacterium]|nr:3-deoxy-7-phosphoheptulonate synthase [Myxococcales bacterium]